MCSGGFDKKDQFLQHFNDFNRLRSSIFLMFDEYKWQGLACFCVKNSGFFFFLFRCSLVDFNGLRVFRNFSCVFCFLQLIQPSCLLLLVSRQSGGEREGRSEIERERDRASERRTERTLNSITFHSWFLLFFIYGLLPPLQRG